MNDARELFVGYLPHAPAWTAPFLRPRLALLALLLLAVAGVVLASQDPAPNSRFEFGVQRTFEGVLASVPVPSLRVARPGRTGAHDAESSYPLVAFGKFGAQARVAEFAGRRVRLRGTLIHHDGQTMVELADDPFEDLGPGAPDPVSAMALGEVVLDGEIVDSKCYLGVMKPGHTKVHRACAVRCIAGGIPPVLMVRDAEGRATYALLVGPAGESIGAAVLPLVADPVRVRGRLERHGERLVLRADPAAIERLGGD